MAAHERHDRHDIHDIHDIHYIHYRQYIQYMTYRTYMTYITHMTYITYICIHYRQYIQYMTYMTYITDITDTLHFLRFQSMTRHDMTLLHILTYGSCAHGKGKRTEEKKKQSYAHSCYQRSLAPIQAHALPSACRAESCLLCCQSEPSLSRYLLDYHVLLHDRLADCKLKGDELST